MNLRTPKRADLQSAAIDHSTTPPHDTLSPESATSAKTIRLFCQLFCQRLMKRKDVMSKFLPIQFTRQQLYDLVWKEPMVKIAKEYGLSDRGFAKLCERNSVPVPPRGYWARKRAGKKDAKPRLTKVYAPLTHAPAYTAANL